jgi:hypothetical protein
MKLPGLLSVVLANAGRFLGFGRAERPDYLPAAANPRVADKSPSVVFRGGRPYSQLECPSCHTNTRRAGLCRNRMCREFNAATARTHPDLLSLCRPIRLAAQDRWGHGGMARLWAA